MQRDTQSKFLDSLSVSKRGLVKVASSQLPGSSKQDVKKVLKAFEKSPDVPKKVLVLFLQRAELDSDPKKVAQDFFESLNKTRKNMNQLHLVTAMTLRHAGIFKVAGRDVYEDLETGDFWKISDDKKHVLRLFKEDENGISDKKAAKEVDAVQLMEYYEVTYKDSTGQMGTIGLYAGKPMDAKTEVEAMLKQGLGGQVVKVQKSRPPKWLEATDENYGTKTVVENEQLKSAFEKLLKEIDKAK